MRNRSGKLIHLLAAGALALCTLSAYAVPRGRPDPRFVDPDQIDPAQGTEILEAFRSTRTAGDYIFDFTMENRPRRGKSWTITGRMAGTWNEQGEAVTRSDLYLTKDVLHLLYTGGTNGTLYKSTNNAPAALLDESSNNTPIVDGLTFTPFDLRMPFLFWTDYVYEGTKKLLGRPAHYFLLYPPEDFDNPLIGAVRVAIDANFKVMLMAEELDTEGKPIKEFQINGFKKVDGQWIVKEIDLVDAQTRDRTRFKVIDAQFPNLPKELFQPPPAGAPLPEIPDSIP